MRDICDKRKTLALKGLKAKRKTLALKGLEAKRIASQIEATQMNYLVACAAKNRAAADSSRAEYHRLLDSLLDLHAITAELSEDVMTSMIEVMFGDDEDASVHVQTSGSKVH